MRSNFFEDGFDFGGGEAGAFLPGEAGALGAAAFAELAAERGVGAEAQEGVAQARGVEGIEVEDGVAADFGEAGGVRAGDGEAGAHGLDDGESEALGDGGLHVGEGVGVGPGEFGVGDVAGQNNLRGAGRALQRGLNDGARVIGGAGAEEDQEREFGELGLQFGPDGEEAALVFVFGKSSGVEEERFGAGARPGGRRGGGRAEVGGAAGDDDDFSRVVGKHGGEALLAVGGVGEDAAGAVDGERGAESVEMVARALAAGDPRRAVFVNVGIENVDDERRAGEGREAGGGEGELAAGFLPRGADLKNGAGEEAAAGNDERREGFGVGPEGIVAALGDGHPAPGDVELEEFAGLLKDVARGAGGAV